MSKHCEFEDWLWTIEDGKVELWKNLCDQHLANVYCYFRTNLNHPRRDQALAWLMEEATRREATHYFKNVDNYGCYPYKQVGRYVVYDKVLKKLVPLANYDWNRLPPEVKNYFSVVEMLCGME